MEAAVLIACALLGERREEAVAGEILRAAARALELAPYDPRSA